MELCTFEESSEEETKAYSIYRLRNYTDIRLHSMRNSTCNDKFLKKIEDRNCRDLFDEFCYSDKGENLKQKLKRKRRPRLNNLYNEFNNVCNWDKTNTVLRKKGHKTNKHKYLHWKCLVKYVVAIDYEGNTLPSFIHVPHLVCANACASEVHFVSVF